MKKVTHDNHRIEVRPNLWHPRGLRPGDDKYNEYAQRVCEEIEQAIRKHVDSLEPMGFGDLRPAPGSVRVIFDAQEECSHCGLPWEAVTEADLADPDWLTDDHSVVGEPQCCSRAAIEFRQENNIPLGALRGWGNA